VSARRHVAPHAIVPIWKANQTYCEDCGRAIVIVEPEEGSRNRSHWRHKPESYCWGQRITVTRIYIRSALNHLEHQNIAGAMSDLRAAQRETR
jgi:hypothetical protein